MTAYEYLPTVVMPDVAGDISPMPFVYQTTQLVAIVD